MDNEIKGTGNSLNYKYRMHDPRLGRFFAIDPLFKKYPHNSPYAFSENRVIHMVELEGLESAWPSYNGLNSQQINEINQTVSKKSGETAINILEFTDVEDATVLASWILPGDAHGVRGEEASSWDKGFAAAGIFLPLVSGSAVKKVFKGISEGAVSLYRKVFKKIKKTIGPLPPNSVFKTGKFGYIAKSDKFGRLSEVAGELKLDLGSRGKHNPNSPGKVKGEDHAGHIIADMFGGSGDLDNIVSQAQKVNQSLYKKLENTWKKALQNGQKVEVKIKINYADDTSLRPESFDVSYKIDDGKWKTKHIENTNQQN